MTLDTRTHYVPAFTMRSPAGLQETVCGLFVDPSRIARTGVRPTCWGCAGWLDGNEPEEPEVDRPRRRLTRDERLQAMADAGCDTWEEYEGLR